jgi:hypothetical protein
MLQEQIGNVPANHRTGLLLHLKWLGDNAAHAGIEVRQQNPRQLQATS